MKDLLPWDTSDPARRYVPAIKTDVTKTIRREQARLATMHDAQQRADAEAKTKVQALKRKPL
jgi:hypothetical protein